ncbi:hypothetical protein ACOSQ2_023040 [Xanthoceras sorbifolium]
MSSVYRSLGWSIYKISVITRSKFFRRTTRCSSFLKTIASPGPGILVMDEANVTCRKRLASIGLDNTDANGQAYRTMLVTAPAFGQYVSGLDGLCCLLPTGIHAYYCEHPQRSICTCCQGSRLGSGSLCCYFVGQWFGPPIVEPEILLEVEHGSCAEGQSEVEATLNLNAMNQAPNPWHVSLWHARALQKTRLKTWKGKPENVKEP